MQQSFTPTLLVKYLYQETTASETLQVRQWLRECPDARQEMARLRKAHQQLPKVVFGAPKRTLKTIKAYSQQAAYHKHF